MNSKQHEIQIIKDRSTHNLTESLLNIIQHRSLQEDTITTIVKDTYLQYSHYTT